MSEEFEFDRTATRDEAAGLLRGLADGIAAGSIRIEDGERSTESAVAEDLEVSVEFEAEDGDRELEVELEWEDDGDGADAAGKSDAEGADADAGSAAGSDDAPGGEGAPGEGVGDGDPDGGSPSGGVSSADEGPPAGDGPPAGEAPPTVEGSPGTAEELEPADLGETGPAGVESVGPAGPVESLGRFELYADRADQWRWRLVHRNGNVIATGGQGYTRKHNAVKGLESVRGNAPGAAIVELLGEE